MANHNFRSYGLDSREGYCMQMIWYGWPRVRQNCVWRLYRYNGKLRRRL